MINPVRVIDNSIPIIKTKKGFRLKSKFLLMQSTGLLDRNGIEMFEGDLVSTADGIWKIEYIKEFGKLAYVSKKEITDLTMYRRSNQVIGNIYENKSLIPKGMRK